MRVHTYTKLNTPYIVRELNFLLHPCPPMTLTFVPDARILFSHPMEHLGCDIPQIDGS